MRPWKALSAVLFALAGLGIVAPADAQQQPRNDAGTAYGLIVKLREAPSRMNALGIGSGSGNDAAAAFPAAAADEPERMQKLLADTGLRAALGRPVGRAARLVDFGAPLDAARAEALADRLRLRAEVEWVVPNEREQRLTTPSDPLFPASAQSTGQWWLHSAGGSNSNVLTQRLRGVPGLLPAWTQQVGNRSAVVAVLDTGSTSHPDLNANLLPGHDFVSSVEFANDGDGRDGDASDPGDWVSQADKDRNPALFGTCSIDPSSWHGTIVAGIIAAVTDNGFGVAGINWNGRVLPVRVAGKCGAEVADLIDGMRWSAGLTVAGAPANANPARLINISFGGSAACNAAYQDAIDELRTRGAVVVAAAGNDRGAVKRPASCAGVIGVAALNRDGFKATYSNFGPAVLVSTVGGDPTSEGLWGTLLGDDGLLTLDNLGLRAPEAPSYGRQAGTSFATPVVAGALSLMLSVNPSLSAAQLIDGVRRSARPHVVSQLIGVCGAANPGRCACSTATCGAGILDAVQALAYAADPASYVTPAQSGTMIDSNEVVAAVALGADQPANPAPDPGTAASSGGGSLGGASLAATLLALLVLMGAGRGRTRRNG